MWENGPFINEEFFAEMVSPTQIDRLWADGWRHFGNHFFRYSVGIYNIDIRLVIPLRVKLADFSFSKSQRRILRKNSDLTTSIRPVEITPEKESLFDRHKLRFTSGVPDNIYDFIPADAAVSPCSEMEMSVFDNGKLIAASFFDIGETAISSVYAMFEPAESTRGLGIFTLLKEIELSIEGGKEYFYLGYCYDGESFYDYKKRFHATEMYDWRGEWRSSEFRF